MVLRVRRAFAVILVLTLSAAAPNPRAASGAGKTAGSGDLAEHLAGALASPRIEPRASAAMAVDLTTGQVVFSRHPDLPLEPASNEKLCVTYGALVELGLSYRFRTEVLGEGRQVGSVWRGRLVLKGYGDPSLTSLDLIRLANLLQRQGIRRVTGHIVGDASWFDARMLATGWLPSFVGVDSPPLSALVVDRARRHGRLVADPPLAAAALFDQILRARGIDARDAVTGRAGSAAVTLAAVHSKPLPELLERMDRVSDNFIAELVLKAIGAEAIGNGSTAAGAAVVRRDLEAAGVPLAGVRVVDGSGLSRSDRVTARELVALLSLIWSTPSLREITLAALPVAGETGTLKHRMEYRPARSRVHAKTGTTNVASALSGYVGGRYAFAVLANGHPVDVTLAESGQDRFAQVLAAAVQAAKR
jgi:D-alanyl-D-alanine carboxypeptidase/D-alanyl-D-alanine-endopeptidase (penicillin-binding protein 4)